MRQHIASVLHFPGALLFDPVQEYSLGRQLHSGRNIQQHPQIFGFVTQSDDPIAEFSLVGATEDFFIQVIV